MALASTCRELLNLATALTVRLLNLASAQGAAGDPAPLTPPHARELLRRAASEPRHHHQAAAGTCGDVRREANMVIPWNLVVISQASACALALLRITHTSKTSHRPAATKTAVWAA